MRAEQQYIDLFVQNEDLISRNSSSVMNYYRAQAFVDFEKIGFPSTKTEDYKHTDLQQVFMVDYGLNINRLAIPVNPFEVFRCNVPNLSTLLYFMVNDSFYHNLKSTYELPEGVFAGSLRDFSETHSEIAKRYYAHAASTEKDGVVALNTMFAQDGFVLYVPKNVHLEQSIQLINIFRSDVDMMANRRVLIILEENSEAHLLSCDHSIDDVKFLATQVIEIFAEENARLDYYDLEAASSTTQRLSSVYVKQKANSDVLFNGITLNNGLTRNNYFVDLEGEHAEISLLGMSILDREQQLDTYSLINHKVPYCKSKELFKNVLQDRSLGAFSGKILVQEPALKTEAYQTNRNLCTTRECRMYSKPQLEIYADDVKCSHGLTTGQLDEDAIFYMQSRGISQKEARLLLSVAFTADVIESVRLEALKERLHDLVEKRFRGEIDSSCQDCNACRGKSFFLRK